MRSRDLVGRRITAVHLRRFRTMRHGAKSGDSDYWATDPIITLDNGERLQFLVQETETDRYGIRLLVIKKECRYGDPLCPCQDGDMCHYEGPNPMTPPQKGN